MSTTAALLGGNMNYFRPTAEFRYFRPHTKHQNVIAVRLLASHVRGFAGTSVPFYERFFPGGDFDIRGFDFRSLGPISFLTRTVQKLDPETGDTDCRAFRRYRVCRWRYSGHSERGVSNSDCGTNGDSGSFYGYRKCLGRQERIN